MDWVLRGSSVTPTDASCLDFSVFVAFCRLLASHADIPLPTSCEPLAVFPCEHSASFSRRMGLCETASPQPSVQGAQLACTMMRTVVNGRSLFDQGKHIACKYGNISVWFLVLTQTLCLSRDNEGKWLRSVKPQQGSVSAGTVPRIVYADLFQPLSCKCATCPWQ